MAGRFFLVFVQNSTAENVAPIVEKRFRVMLLQKRTQFERRRWADEPEEQKVEIDPLFEREWEIFVVRRDPETGEFVTATVAADELEMVG